MSVYIKKNDCSKCGVYTPEVVQQSWELGYSVLVMPVGHSSALCCPRTLRELPGLVSFLAGTYEGRADLPVALRLSLLPHELTVAAGQD